MSENNVIRPDCLNDWFSLEGTAQPDDVWVERESNPLFCETTVIKLLKKTFTIMQQCLSDMINLNMPTLCSHLYPSCWDDWHSKRFLACCRHGAATPPAQVFRETFQTRSSKDIWHFKSGSVCEINPAPFPQGGPLFISLHHTLMCVIINVRSNSVFLAVSRVIISNFSRFNPSSDYFVYPPS